MRLPSKSQIVWAAIPVAFVLLMLLFFPFRYRIEFDTDEGINAIKAMMVLRGYRLYSEIWSDQPPLFTFLLTVWFRAFGLRLTAARLMVLLFSAGQIALGTSYLRKNWGILAAVSGGLMLVLLPYFLRLSVSIMIGLPAIALAVASFYMLAEWHSRPVLGRLVASGLLLGLSILTKGFTAVLVPIWLIGILANILRNPTLIRQGRHRWLGPAAWLTALGLVVGLGLLLIVRTEYLSQLLSVHLIASQSDEFAIDPEHRTLASYLSESWPIFALAAVGAGWAVKRRNWSALYLAGWIVAGYAFLVINQPTWYHHQLLLTVPAALLAAIAVGASIDDVRFLRPDWPRARRWALGLGSLGVFLVFLVIRLPGTAEGLDPRLPNLSGPGTDEEDERSLLAAINDHASQTQWFYTDRPIFAFLADIPVPPNLAVISQKRLFTGGLTEQEVAATLDTYAPEMVLNSRFGLSAVAEYMRTRNFTRIDETIKYRLYFRRPP